MIILDTETTGLLPRRHSIGQISALEYENPENRFDMRCQMQPGRSIDPEALNYNDLEREELLGRTTPPLPTLEHTLHEFLKWKARIADQTLAGRNLGTFDVPMILTALESLKILNQRELHRFTQLTKRTVELHSEIYRTIVKLGMEIPIVNGHSGITTDYSLIFVGLPPEPKPHEGMMGVLTTFEAFYRLQHGKGYLPEFQQYPVPKHLQTSSKAF